MLYICFMQFSVSVLYITIKTALKYFNIIVIENLLVEIQQVKARVIIGYKRYPMLFLHKWIISAIFLIMPRKGLDGWGPENMWGILKLLIFNPKPARS